MSITHHIVVQMALTRAWGGLEMMALHYAQQLSERGYKSLIITLHHSPLEQKARALGFEVLTLPKSVYFSPLSSLRLSRFFKRQQATLIMVHHLRDLWLLRPALLGTQIEVIGFAHMFLKNISKKDFLHRWLYAPLKCLVALTQIQKTELAQCLPLSPERILVLPNGIDLKKFSPEKRSESLRQTLFKVRDSDLLVGVVGRLDPQKGQLEFLQSAQKVLAIYPHTVFALIGQPNQDGFEYLAQLKNFIKKHHMENHVRFVDHLDDVSSAMASLDIFVLPSYQEAFGNVLIEAMACGVPVIATAAGGPLEIVTHLQSGLLVTPKNIQNMTQALLRYISNPTLRKTCAQQGLSESRKKYDQHQILSQLESVIQAPCSRIFSLSSQSRILLLHLSSLGDVISGLIVYQGLYKAGHHVDLCLQDHQQSLFQDESIPTLNLSQIQHRHYDVIIDLTSSGSTRRLVKKLKAPLKVGRATGWIKHLKAYWTYNIIVDKNPHHQIVRNFDVLLEVFGLQPPKLPQLTLKKIQPLQASWTPMVTQYFSNSSPQIKIGFHPFSKDRLRTLPTELVLRFIEVFHKQLEKGQKIILIGEPQEAEELLRLLPEHPFLYQPFSLDQLKEVLSSLDLFIGSDSGPLHLAASLGIPCLGCWGPTLPQHTRPLSPQLTILETPQPCRPCHTAKPCHYQRRCLQKISTPQIEMALQRSLA